jgi:hypothetical protein
VNVTGKALWYIESHLTGGLPLDAIAGSIGVLAGMRWAREFNSPGSSSPNGKLFAIKVRRKNMLDVFLFELHTVAPHVLVFQVDPIAWQAHHALDVIPLSVNPIAKHDIVAAPDRLVRRNLTAKLVERRVSPAINVHSM